MAIAIFVLSLLIVILVYQPNLDFTLIKSLFNPLIELKMTKPQPDLPWTLFGSFFNPKVEYLYGPPPR